jgi:GNAT acetyltransferase-like protein
MSNPIEFPTRSPFPMALHITTHDWHDWLAIAPAWADLVDRCPDATFFVTAGWVETWLESFAIQLRPKIVTFERDGRVVGACLLVRRNERRGPFLIRRIYLHTAGEPDRDSPQVELDVLLCEPGHELAMACALRDYLDDLRPTTPWDELVMPGMVEGAGRTALLAAFDDMMSIDHVRPSQCIGVDELRPFGFAFDNAPCVDDALAYFDELARMHSGWTSAFRDFHRALIAKCVPLGQIELVRVHDGAATIGWLYNVVFGGRTYVHQHGFDDETLHERLVPASCRLHWQVWRAANARQTLQLLRTKQRLQQGVA